MKEGKTLESRVIHDGKVVHLSVDRVELPNGRVTELEVIHHQGAAAVVPLTSSPAGAASDGAQAPNFSGGACLTPA